MSDKEIAVASPLNGTIFPLSQTKDEVFSQGLLEKGVVIEPTGGKICAPFNGHLASLFPTHHAIGLTSTEGVELLIHIGMDTVELNGEYFEVRVQQGDQVKKGELLISFDIEKIKKAGHELQTPVVITNSGDYTTISITKEKNMLVGEILFKVEK